MDTYERVIKILAEYTPEEARRRINAFFKYESPEPDAKTEENMNNSSVCKCCSGIGTQVRGPDKIVILCPCCNGTGNPPNTVTY